MKLIRCQALIDLDPDTYEEARAEIAEHGAAGFCWPDETGLLNVVSLVVVSDEKNE